VEKRELRWPESLTGSMDEEAACQLNWHFNELLSKNNSKKLKFLIICTYFSSSNKVKIEASKKLENHFILKCFFQKSSGYSSLQFND
jgi:hypothetical protein